ncbi:uncharacterized protein SPSK_01679 [Sporothrix schenckii 1099-18]|uniref:Uncharacterized protein n=1 Tax=Sporothrix schenckii 1099-18 TaxID=1397361 RepID=A0A0F2MD09_SPOSC|nr:uncharacterized protein SPSK_01679 [Sporothrix schenckii 1099-18]KJR86949.1 hypothetical protein SPSK_01679 [Sporothrix schenckii 1099-18]
MDLAYSQQQQARRKNRSAANLQHLSLAPLTSRLPLRDDYDGTDIIDSHSYFSHAHTSSNSAALARIPSYIQGRSAPATPRLLSKSPTASRSHSHEGRRRAHVAGGGSRTPGGTGHSSKAHTGALAKSLSTTQLHIDGNHQHLRSNGTGGARQHRRRKTDHGHHEGGGDDWLFRAAVLVASEARESKGQSWLTARASSTSLSGLRSAEEAEDVAAFERELAREREYLDRIAGSSRRGSRRGSLDHDVTSPIASAHGHGPASRSGSRFGSRAGSHLGSRPTSRTHSRAGSRVQLLTPLDTRRHSPDYNGMPATGEAGYFDYAEVAEDDGVHHNHLATPAGPDFVNLDDALEAIELHQRDMSLEDEDHIRRLVKREKAGGVMGSWLGNVFGWSLFSVQEIEGEVDDDDDYDDDEDEEDGDEDEVEEDDDTEADVTERRSDDIFEEGSVGQDGKAAANGRRRRSRKRRGWNRQGPTVAANRRRFEGDESHATEDPVPPPPGSNEGTWQDAAWLLSVASKVIL